MTGQPSRYASCVNCGTVREMPDLREHDRGFMAHPTYRCRDARACEKSYADNEPIRALRELMSRPPDVGS